MNLTDRIVGSAALLATAALAGCSGTAGSPGTTSSRNSSTTNSTTVGAASPSTTTPPGTPTTPQQRALAAYRAMWAAWVTAAQTSDATSTTVGRHATGNALELILTSLAQDRQEGMVTRGQPVLHPRVQSATPPAVPTHVTVADCADTRNWLKYRTSNGSLKDNVPGGRHAVTAVVQNVSGTWMVVQLVVQPVGTC